MSTAVPQPNISIPATTAGMDRSGDVSGGSEWDVVMRGTGKLEGGNLTNVIHPWIPESCALKEAPPWPCTAPDNNKSILDGAYSI
jgi:hypothetical protein